MRIETLDREGLLSRYLAVRTLLDSIGKSNLYTMENQKQETLGQQLGRLGGLATSKTHDRAHYQRMALKSAEARRKKSKKRHFEVKFAS